MEINTGNLKTFRKDFGVAVKELEEKYGVNLSLGNIRYDDTKFSGKLEVRNKNAKPAIQEDYAKYKIIHNLPALGSKIDLNGESHVITGFKPRSRKYPVLVKSSSGTVYKVSVSMVKNNLIK